MPWIIEVKVQDQWFPLKATAAAEPYKYETKLEAERMMGMCYPDEIVKIKLGAGERVRVSYMKDKATIVSLGK